MKATDSYKILKYTLYFILTVFATVGYAVSLNNSSVSAENLVSPHYSHINVLDFGRGIPYLPRTSDFNGNDENDRDEAIRWYAEHIDAQEAIMSTFVYHDDYEDNNSRQYWEIATDLRAQNDKIKLFGYDIDFQMCQHEVCSWCKETDKNDIDLDGNTTECLTENILNTDQSDLPESYYLHFAYDTDLEFIPLPGYPELPIKTMSIKGCPTGPVTKDCRVQIFGWADYAWLANLKDIGWRESLADQLLSEVNGTYLANDTDNYMDGIFLDAHAPGLSITVGFGYQTIIKNLAAGGGKIREYGNKAPDSNRWDAYEPLETEYNVDMVSWLAHLKNRFDNNRIDFDGDGDEDIVPKFIIVNTAGYSADSYALAQAQAAGGMMTENMHQPDGIWASTYQGLVDSVAAMINIPGGKADLYGNPGWYGHSILHYTPGNYPDTDTRYWMWRLASYYALKEPVGSLGTVYFNPSLNVTGNLDFMNEWLPAYEYDVGQPLDDPDHQNKAFVYQEGTRTCTGENSNGDIVSYSNIPYKIFARRYTNDTLMLVRPRDDRVCTDYGDESAITINLLPEDNTPKLMLMPDGTLASIAAPMKIRQGEALILFADNQNSAPVFNEFPDQNVNEKQTLLFTVSATDANGDNLTYSASPLPLGATFDGLSRIFSWIPDYNQSGIYSVTFSADDGKGGVGTDVVGITVNNTNQAPVLNPIGNKTINENSLLTFAVSGSDPDGDSLTYKAIGLPVGARFENNIFSWIPDSLGTYSTTFIVSDNGIPILSDSETVAITVTLSPNALYPPEIQAIAQQHVNENSSLSFTVTATDFNDGDTLILTASNLPAGATFIDNGSRTGTFTWTPDYFQSGTYIVTFSVTDASTMVSQDVTIQAVNVNQLPILGAIKNAAIDEMQAIEFVVTAVDPDNDEISLDAQPLPSGAVFEGGVFHWTPDTRQAGIYDIEFTAADAEGGISKDTAQITVNAVNEAPELNSLKNQTTNENSLLTFALSASDPDGDVLTYSSSALPSGAALDSKTGIFTWTPTYDQAGTYRNIYFQAKDSHGVYSNLITLMITVNDVNRAPAFTVIGDKTLVEGEVLTFDVSAADPDGDAINYSAEGLPDGATFNGQTFNWPTDENQAGTYVVTFKAQDSKNAIASQSITITVSEKIQISNLKVTAAVNFATAAWITNVPTASQIAYGLTEGYGSLSAAEPTLRTKHRIVLSGLSANTLYHFAIHSTDSFGELSVSSDYTFSTKASRNGGGIIINKSKLIRRSFVPADSKKEPTLQERYKF